MSELMSRVSKDGTLINPTADEREKRLLGVKYLIFRDMAEAQSRYRKLIDSHRVELEF
jgi:D-ribulokinase